MENSTLSTEMGNSTLNDQESLGPDLDLGLKETSLYDVTYSQNRPLLIVQCFCIFALVLLKYVSQFTSFRLKSVQSKLFGVLILT
jgi:hypothetical protein